MNARSRLVAAVDGRQEKLRALARRVWELAEIGLEERESAAALAQVLRDEGFRVEAGTAGMETAFVAEYGSGRPVLGLLGEYDALPELSQEVSAERGPVIEGGPGHGCGHNLLGVAALGAALALKDAMDAGNCPGTVRFYGCPAEETLSGKVHMAAAGAFEDLDVCLTWHPGSMNAAWSGSSLALNSARFTFHGRSSHAAASPDAGRSALDAAELMNVAANYLREHVSPEARIHYVITDGGHEPNVVPSRAQVWYYVRGPRRSDVQAIYGRLLKVAEGACLMTETTYDVELLAGCYDYLPNVHLTRVLWEEMTDLGGPDFDGEDERFAREVAVTFPEGQLEAVRERARQVLGPDDEYLHHGVAPWRDPADERPFPASTDVGDVSYLVPTGQFSTACAPLGVAGHTWQYTAASGSSVGMKGMLHAARVLARAGHRLLTSPADIEHARSEFADATRNRPYRSPLDGDGS